MGWLFMPKPASVKQYLTNNCTFDGDMQTHRCLAIAMKINVAYVAVETTEKGSGERKVWAAIFLMRYVRDEYGWGYKDMSEDCGPVQADCPARILDLLSPTDNENALKWRAACRRAIERRMPKIGTKVRFEKPIQFRSGAEESEFTVVKYGRRGKALRNEWGDLFRLKRTDWRYLSWSIVKEGARQ